MRINFKIIALVVSLNVYATPAIADVNVFACEPEYAALATEIIGTNDDIYSATTALQDPHFVQARPSLISKMRRADIAICAGAELETGWLPMLQMKSNNRDVKNGGKGMFYAADYIDNLDIPVKVDRSMGDVHTQGNPHVHLDPHRVLKLAKALTDKLVELDAENGQKYQQNFSSFESKWQQAIKDWQKKAEPLKGKKVIAYHSSFRYLMDFLQMQQVADLEPKPGMPPTTSHLNGLVEAAKSNKVSAIIYTGYQDSKGAEWLSSKTGIAALQLPYTVGGNEQSVDLFSLMDSHIDLLLKAVKG